MQKAQEKVRFIHLVAMAHGRDAQGRHASCGALERSVQLSCSAVQGAGYFQTESSRLEKLLESGKVGLHAHSQQGPSAGCT